MVLVIFVPFTCGVVLSFHCTSFIRSVVTLNRASWRASFHMFCRTSVALLSCFCRAFVQSYCRVLPYHFHDGEVRACAMIFYS